jgi:hypothetical protein
VPGFPACVSAAANVPPEPSTLLTQRSRLNGDAIDLYAHVRGVDRFTAAKAIWVYMEQIEGPLPKDATTNHIAPLVNGLDPASLMHRLAGQFPL